jgi:hypothetical protein
MRVEKIIKKTKALARILQKKFPNFLHAGNPLNELLVWPKDMQRPMLVF